MSVRTLSAMILTACGVALAAAPAAGQARDLPAVPAMPVLPVMPAMPVLPALPDVAAFVDLAKLADLATIAEPVLATLPSPEVMRAVDMALAGVDQAVSAADRARGLAERAADDRQRDEDRKEREADQRGRAEDQYQRAQELLDRREWARAVDRFNTIIDAKSSRTDAALYWKAYALDKLSQQADALAALAELTKGYPSSRWMSDAKALEIQVRQRVGQPVNPEAESDEELKLLAIQGLQHSDPAQAVPMLEKFLQGNQSPRLKQRALFVLAQSNSAQAREILSGIAKGGSNPDLQSRAIQYLGIHGGAENRKILADIYASSTDVNIKRQILRSFMVSGDKARVLNAATTETNPELRVEAVRQLGVMGAREELGQLYAKETSVDVKKQLLQAMFVGGDATRLIEVANNETNVELRRTAVRQLGTMNREKTGAPLVTIYGKEKDADIKQQAINGLFIQNNAEDLVAIARKETDPAMKKAIVSKLSLMKSKVALDYLMEILNK